MFVSIAMNFPTSPRRMVQQFAHKNFAEIGASYLENRFLQPLVQVPKEISRRTTAPAGFRPKLKKTLAYRGSNGIYFFLGLVAMIHLHVPFCHVAILSWSIATAFTLPEVPVWMNSF